MRWRHVREPLANIERAADRKAQKYRELARAYGADILPFACDVYGAMGRDSHRLLRWIFAEARANGRVASVEENRDFCSAAYTTLSVAIQRATAFGALDGIARSRGQRAAEAARALAR